MQVQKKLDKVNIFKGLINIGPFIAQGEKGILKINFFKSDLLKAKISNLFFLRLLKIGKKKSSIFKVVVTNWNHRKVDIIGTIFVNDSKHTKSYINFRNQKKIDLDFEKLMFWMKNKALPSVFLYHVLKIFAMNLNLFNRISRLKLKLKDRYNEREQTDTWYNY